MNRNHSFWLCGQKKPTETAVNVADQPIDICLLEAENWRGGLNHYLKGNLGWDSITTYEAFKVTNKKIDKNVGPQQHATDCKEVSYKTSNDQHFNLLVLKGSVGWNCHPCEVVEEFCLRRQNNSLHELNKKQW